MWPRIGPSKLVKLWILVTVVATVASYLDGGWLDKHAALAPARIWSGEIWRLATWPFFLTLPLVLIYTVLAFIRCGGELAVRWGDTRLRTFLAEVIGCAAVGTTMLALVFDDAMWMSRLGGTVVFNILAIAWAKQFPDRRLTSAISGITISTSTFIKLVIGSNLLIATVAGLVYMAPELIACAAAYYYPAERLRRR